MLSKVNGTVSVTINAGTADCEFQARVVAGIMCGLQHSVVAEMEGKPN